MDMQSVITRDRRVVLFCLFSITALAWLYLVLAGNDVGTSEVTPRGAIWTSSEFILMFIMWAVMMLGMMLPSASPMILMFVRINRNHTKTKALTRPLVSVWIFIAGYAVVWSGFSLVATIAQWASQYAGLLSPMMASANAVFGGWVLIAAGVYQWTPLKHSCL